MPSFGSLEQVFSDENIFRKDYQLEKRNCLWRPCLLTDWDEISIEKTGHICFLPSFGSIGPVVSEENFFLNRPIRNKNCLWRPCLLTDREEMSKFYRGHDINASYQVSVDLAKQFQRRRFKKIGHAC